MNTSINYSGFVDLLHIFDSENHFSADQGEADEAEPAREVNVESVAGHRRPVTDGPIRERP